jgi:hypothetical protein
MKLIWKQKLGIETCPYIVRWVFECKLFSVRLHHWLYSDDTRHKHDHPWDFISIVLQGTITDRSEEGEQKRRWLSVTRFSADHKHSVIVEKPCWTLLVTGPEKRKWGYWVDGKFRKRNKYFYEHGHHNPCDT